MIVPASTTIVSSQVKPSIAIRPATTTSDWQQARGLHYDYVEWIRAVAEVDPLSVQPEFKTEFDALARRYHGTNEKLFVAFSEKHAVATVAVRCHRDRTAEMKRLYVQPAARGFGLAADLVRRVIDTAIMQDCHCVWLETLEEIMDPAIALYRKLGFQRTERNGLALPQGNLIVMERALVKW